MTKKVTRNDLLDRLYSLYNDSVNLVGEYKGMFEETEFKCNICNHTWKDIPSNVLKRHGCLYCRCNDFVNNSKNKFGEQFNYDCTKDTFIGLRKPCKFHCNIHNNDFIFSRHIILTISLEDARNVIMNSNLKEKQNQEISLLKKLPISSEMTDSHSITLNTKDNQKNNNNLQKHGDIEIIPKDF